MAMIVGAFRSGNPLSVKPAEETVGLGHEAGPVAGTETGTAFDSSAAHG